MNNKGTGYFDGQNSQNVTLIYIFLGITVTYQASLLIKNILLHFLTFLNSAF
jgi:hypothetical protein